MTPTLPTAHPPTPRQHTDKAHARQRSTPPHGLSDVTHRANARPAANNAYQLTPDLTASAARERVEARLAAAGARPVPQIGYWQENGGVTYQDPDGREVVFASWIYLPPGS